MNRSELENLIQARVDAAHCLCPDPLVCDRCNHAESLLDAFAHDLIDAAKERLRRWAVLRRTSNSGKTLFVCKCCGRVSPLPDKTCKTIGDPDSGETWGCSGWKGPEA